VPIRTQLIVALVVPALLVLTAVVWLADVSARSSLEASLERRLVSAAQGAATIVPARLVRVSAGDDEARSVRSAQRRLRDLAQATGTQRLVVVDFTDDGVLADSSGQQRVREPFLRAAADAYELGRVQSGLGMASLLFRGPDGTPYKNGYAPLRNEEGIVVAYVAASAPIDYTAALDALRTQMLGTAMLGLALLVVLALGIARWVSVPLRRLAAGAKRIAGGQLEIEVPVEGPAEAQVLADSMNRMSTALRDRDAQLQMMLAGIAHEVRNPLGGIELFGGLLQEDLEPEDPRRRHVDRILVELRTLSRVVNDFLEYARERPPERKRRVAADLLLQTEEMVQHPRLEVDVRTRAWVEADDDRIRSALLNLLKNAEQAAGPEGTIRAEVDADERWVTFSVEDSGPGVPVDKRETIFEPFFTTKQRGTGLGLALVRKTAREHGGAAELTKGKLGGARFTIRLPRASPVQSDNDGPAVGHR
jgi:signal transduction histidine kinase